MPHHPQATGRRPCSTAASCSGGAAWASACWAWPASAPGRANGRRRPTSSPLAPKRPHFPGKAKRVVHLFMNGGPSHVDTFDPKPLLDKYHGKPLPNPNLRTERKTGAAMRSPFRVPEVRPERHRGERALRPDGRMHRRHLRDPFDARRRAEPRAVADADELRRRPPAPPEHGGLGHLRPGLARTRTCPASSPCARAATRSWRPRTGGPPSCPGPIRGRTSTRSTPTSAS